MGCLGVGRMKAVRAMRGRGGGGGGVVAAAMVVGSTVGVVRVVYIGVSAVLMVRGGEGGKIDGRVAVGTGEADSGCARSPSVSRS